MRLVEVDAPPSVQLQHSKLILSVRPGTDAGTREEILAGWYRQILRVEAVPLIEAWERRLGVEVARFYVQQMKTKWGSCNPAARTLRLNTELAKKPKACIEYIVVHEMCHLLESRHGPRFISLMDRALPKWRETRGLLNDLPSRHERWDH